MKNNLTIFQIVIMFMTIGFYNSSENEYELWKKAEILAHEKNTPKALEIYLDIFNKNQTNYEILKKIKEILIEKKDYILLIDCYNKYLDNSLNIKYKFEAEVELIEIKIWTQDIQWLNDLYILEEKYTNDQNKKYKFEFILHQLFKNKKLEEGYNFVLFIRTKYNMPSFFSRKLISIFKENKEYKKSINESIIYLTETSKTNKKSSISQKILIDQIFDLTQKILLESILDKTYLPISDTQLSSNKFLILKQDNKYESENIKYINNIYNTLIEYNLEPETAKIKLADIQYKIFSDLDSAYKILDKLQKNSSKIDINIQTTLMKSNILISKGYLDSALKLINDKQRVIGKYYKKEKTDDVRFKNIEILFYKGDYNKINLAMDSLIYDFELKNKNYNDLLELKMITLFFNSDINQFKRYSLIQHKLRMNKSFESILELIDLINSDNILISELAQFQYALIEFQKGNINNTQKIISDMNTKTVYHEIALVLNAEIEDYINKNYKEAINLYEKIIEKYPDTIYKEDILKRLNQLNKIMIRKLDL
tara:strand:+ start:314 stop:1930 length:1617 start_codon:yes stop_codon:yes gene_type:complete